MVAKILGDYFADYDAGTYNHHGDCRLEIHCSVFDFLQRIVGTLLFHELGTAMISGRAGLKGKQ